MTVLVEKIFSPILLIRLVKVCFCLVLTLFGLCVPGTAFAEMDSLFREMFSTSGTLTAESPGSAFSRVVGTLYQRAGGPSLAGGLPASADPHALHSSACGIYDLPDPSGTGRVFMGGWFYFKNLQQHEGSLLTLLDQYDNPGPQITVFNGKIYGGVAYKQKSACPVVPLRKWIYLAIASVKEEAGNVSLRFYFKEPGQAMKSWGAQDHIYVTREQTTGFQAGFTGNGPTMSIRMGAVGGYTFEEQDFSDVNYPNDIIEPAAQSRHTWYCNPATGSDDNDGTSPIKAWRTASKINDESLHSGIFSGDSYETGDILVIDTSEKSLVLDGVELEFCTPGLTVKAADGQQWIKIKSHRTILPNAWNRVNNSSVFVTDDTELNIVVWENDKFLSHPSGVSYADVEEYLSSTPGSFWTDGNRLYLHPFGSTDPTTDGKIYDRSHNFVRGAPVTLAAPDMQIRDIHTGKTCLAEKFSQDALGGYCLGNKGRAGKSAIRHCYLYYGSKHNLGLTEGGAGDVIVVEDVQVEQGSPYPTFGGQTILVSFSAGASNLGIRHVYKRCRSVSNTGVIGSTQGEMSGRFPVFYSHNLTGENQFESIEFIDCDFGSGGLSGGGMKTFIVKGSNTGSVLMESDVRLESSRINGTLWCKPGRKMVMRNCIFQMEGMQRENPFAGELDVQFSTLDASALTSYQLGVPQSAIFTRTAPLKVTFKNNVVLMPTENVYVNVFSRLQSGDGLNFSNNAYSLNGNRLVYQYDNGQTVSSPELSEWQASGMDANSFNRDDLHLLDHVPQPGSPVIGAALRTNNHLDVTGQMFALRDDMGAVQTLPSDFDDWRNRHFSNEELAMSSTQEAASFANDGISNLMKYAMGLDPRTFLYKKMFAVYPGSNLNEVCVEFQRLSDVSDVIFSVESSLDLNNWMKQDVDDERVEMLGYLHEKVFLLIKNQSGIRKFFRLKINARQQ